MSQFRRDPVSGEWIILAPERAKRPEELHKKQKRIILPKSSCPFEDLKKSGNWPPLAEFDGENGWAAVLLPNKFPALSHAERCPRTAKSGPYQVTDGVGYHELLVTRDHTKNFGDISPELAAQVFRMFASRYKTIDRDKCMAYLSIFGNWGPSAGASVGHPHYQLMALPIVPPNVARSYAGSERYFDKHRRCVHCDILKFERKVKVRIIAENKTAIAFAPFASVSPFEVRIFPKKHISAFERSPEEVLTGAAELLQKVIRHIKKKLSDPDFNFYIHTAPLREENYRHYHWHIELVPHLTQPAGFEFATGIDVNVVAPEAAAKILR